MGNAFRKIAGSRFLKPLLWPLNKRLSEAVRYLAQFNQSNISYERHLRARQQSVDYLEKLEQEIGRPVMEFPTIEALLAHGLSLIPATQPGLILEFGVWKGQSINFIAKRTTATVYGFDSFQGLPETWNSQYPAGHFKLRRLPNVRSNVKLVQGWFNESLPPFLQQHNEPVSFIHVDCDLYSSTKTIFDALAPRMRGNDSSGNGGTVIVFDEFYNYPGWQLHEFKAFYELVRERNFGFEPIGYNSCHSQFGFRITRVG